MYKYSKGCIILFKIQDYTSKSLQRLLEGKAEISQENNYNAYSRLFITDKKTVVKLYVSSPELAKKNTENLLTLSSRCNLDTMAELVLPTELIRFQNQIIGYAMPYIQGRSLNHFLADSCVSDQAKFSVFKQLSQLICELPGDVFIGDLHGENVLVDSEFKIHLIDIDGFSIGKEHQLTAPNLPNICGKYRRKDGTQIISRDSDIYCFYYLFLTWISGSPLVMSEYYHERYVQFLEGSDLPQEILFDVSRLYLSGHNTLNYNWVEKSIFSPYRYRYEYFLSKTGLDAEEEAAARILDAFLTRNGGKI